MKKYYLILAMTSTFSYATPQYIDLKEDTSLNGQLDPSYTLSSSELLRMQGDFILKSDSEVSKGQYQHNDNVIEFTSTNGNTKKHYLGKRVIDGLYKGTWYSNALESGDFELALQSNTGLHGQSCDDVKIKDPSSQSGIHAIELTVDGNPTTANVYCNMDIDQGGWTLVNTREKNGRESHARTQELTDPNVQKNHYIDAATWQALKTNATQIMVTDGNNDNYVVFDFTQLDTANCQVLVDDLVNTPVFHAEPGCTYKGSDYTYLSNPSNGIYFTTVSIYNLDFKPSNRNGNYGTLSSGKMYYAPLNIQIYIR
ncbi:fibrinogen-like YCDxxxxGGGW domain-containing protein [Pseudoalteromonas sp. MMG005]|uniref:fibrinogen-like YCDxxxxGGGW domain-containing protein n=1 Tax=Pseudoalteromonas sp. MMG005 TaxID=2822682 RepID=UPI001B3A5FD8|nr:fibrinogen-like YCDxxxxGGGW domain-containing protein [Pseudoalteromonas sp. MMG005]MBQ4848285.1 hypothetical protein [Pseudoalteromonas sp. MMG005]